MIELKPINEDNFIDIASRETCVSESVDARNLCLLNEWLDHLLELCS